MECVRGYNCGKKGKQCCRECELVNKCAETQGGCQWRNTPGGCPELKQFRAQNQFTKADLRTGDTVILRSGEEGVVLLAVSPVVISVPQEPLNVIALKNKQHTFKIGSFNDDFTYRGGSDFDIMQVIRMKNIHDILDEAKKIDSHSKNIVYDRMKVKEVPAKEAFEVLKRHYGCEVKIKE